MKKSEALYKKAQQEPLQVVRKLINVTEEYMHPRVNMWQRYRRKYRRGLRYLSGIQRGTPLYFTNYIFSIVETIRANLTKNLPPITIRARGGKADQIAADILSKVVTGELIAAGFKKRVQSVVQHALLTGVAWFKIGLDPTGHGGMGSLAVDVIAPEDMLVDPICLYPEDARWFIHLHRDISHERIFAAYGKVPEPLVPQNKDFFSHSVKYYENQITRGHLDRERLRPAAEVSPVSDVYECWIRNWDNSPELISEVDPVTGQEIQREGEQKPSWYIITIAENTVLRNIASPYAHDQAPFVPFFDVEDDGAESIYYRGIGQVEEIEPQQDKADALDQRIYQNISLTANRQKFISAQSGLNVDALDNTAGRNYKVNGDPSRAVYHDNPPSLSSDVYAYRQGTELLIQTVSGIFDVTQGRRPVGITAGRAIQSLKEAADVRLEFKTRGLADAIKEISNLALQIILQFYDGRRIIKLTDADQKDASVVILDEYPEIPGFDVENPEMRQLFKQQAGIDLVLTDIDFDYDIEVDSDSALPASRAERGQLAGDLFRLGAIDRQSLLETLDWPKINEIMKRLGMDITGKSAGDPMAEAFGTAGAGQQQVMDNLMQQLTAAGLSPEMVQQLMAGIGGAMQQGQKVPPQGGDFPPQIVQ